MPKRILTSGVVALVLIVAIFTTTCTDFSQFPTTTPQPPSAVEKTPTVIRTSESAILTVYEYLLSKAEGPKAKTYIADFYTACTNWSAAQELQKDGSSIWYVLVDMTGIKDWKQKPYWQQTGWFILPDGKVIPSSRLQANALRIEADLQELSLTANP